MTCPSCSPRSRFPGPSPCFRRVLRRDATPPWRTDHLGLSHWLTVLWCRALNGERPSTPGSVDARKPLTVKRNVQAIGGHLNCHPLAHLSKISRRRWRGGCTRRSLISVGASLG